MAMYFYPMKKSMINLCGSERVKKCSLIYLVIYTYYKKCIDKIHKQVWLFVGRDYFRFCL